MNFHTDSAKTGLEGGSISIVPSSIRAHIVAACIFGGGALALIATSIFPNVPGDLGDSRWNVYILEHIYRWLAGSDPELLSPRFFYPWQWTIFWSETHTGTALIYSFCRMLGSSHFRAYELWFFTGYATSYLAAHYALARMGANAIEAAIGGAIFAFGLPGLGGIFVHCQLVYRAGVPLALLYLWEGLSRGSVRSLALSAFWLCWQITVTIYLGFFLLLFIAAFGGATLIVSRRNHPNIARALIDDLARILTSPGRGDLPVLVATATMGLAAAALLYGHSRVARLYGFSQPHWLMTGFLPHPASYLTMDALPYWATVTRSLPDVLMLHVPEWARGEHQLFVGSGVAILFLSGVATLALRPKLAGGLPAKTMLAALVTLGLLTLRIKGYSLYEIVSLFPGLSAIRAVSRIIFVLMFPVAVVAVVGVRGLRQGLRSPAIGTAVVAACVVLTVYEITAFPLATLSFSPRAAQIRVDSLIGEARSAQSGITQPILAYRVGDLLETQVAAQIDAMFAAQQLGWPTLNGYSGNVPPGTSGPTNCTSLIRQLGNFSLWRKDHGDDAAPLSQFLPRLVFTGWPNCRLMATPENLPSFTNGQPPSDDLPSHVTLASGTTEQRHDLLSFVVRIRNAGTEMMPATSPNPIILIWRFVLDDGASHIWDSFAGEMLAADILPGTEHVEIFVTRLPQRRGAYKLQVSAVAIGRYWFHDRGMPILTFPDAVVVP